MSEESLSCPVCLEEYDLSVHLPKILPSCSHSLCHDCLKKLIKVKSTRCPECRKDILAAKILDIEDFPTNICLMDAIEEKLKPQLCSKHGKELLFVCMVDGEKLCTNCGLFDHRKTCASAQIRDISCVKEQADKKALALDKMMESLKDLTRKQRDQWAQFKNCPQKISAQKGPELFGAFNEAVNKLYDELRKAADREVIKSQKIMNLNKEAASRIEKYQTITLAAKPQDILELNDEELAQRVEIELQSGENPDKVAFDGKLLEWNALLEKMINEFKAFAR